MSLVLIYVSPSSLTMHVTLLEISFVFLAIDIVKNSGSLLQLISIAAFKVRTVWIFSHTVPMLNPLQIVTEVVITFVGYHAAFPLHFVVYPEAFVQMAILVDKSASSLSNLSADDPLPNIAMLSFNFSEFSVLKFAQVINTELVEHKIAKN